MERLLGFGLIAMVAACSVVGLRLLWLSTRTRQAPELLLGGSFLLFGAIGYPLAILARGGAGGAPSPGLLFAALAVQDLACLCMAAATWRTFRPSDSWGAVLCALMGAGLGASVFGAFATGSPNGGFAYYLGFFLRAATFFWAAWESGNYYGLLRRRLAIGLANPIVVDRFRLWTLSTVGIVLGFAIFLIGRLTTENAAAAPFVLAATSAVSLVSAVTMWLAFVPPASYRRRVEAKGPQQS
jgi:hypothetical protein